MGTGEPGSLLKTHTLCSVPGPKLTAGLWMSLSPSPPLFFFRNPETYPNRGLSRDLPGVEVV